MMKSKTSTMMAKVVPRGHVITHRYRPIFHIIARKRYIRKVGELWSGGGGI